MNRYLHIFLVLFLVGCSGSVESCARKKVNEVIKPPPQVENILVQGPKGSATAPLVIDIVNPPIDSSVGELETLRNLAQVQQTYLAARSAVMASQVTLLNKRIEQAKQDRIQDWLYWIAGLSLLGMAVCVGLFIWSPIGKKVILAIGTSLAAMVVIAFTFSAIVPYLVWIAGSTVVIVIGYALYSVFYQSKLTSHIIDTSNKLEKASPEEYTAIKMAAMKEQIKAGVAGAIASLLDKARKAKK